MEKKTILEIIIYLVFKMFKETYNTQFDPKVNLAFSFLSILIFILIILIRNTLI